MGGVHRTVSHEPGWTSVSTRGLSLAKMEQSQEVNLRLCPTSWSQMQHFSVDDLLSSEDGKFNTYLCEFVSSASVAEVN